MDINSDQYRPYSEREEWKDVIPISQNDHDRIVCKINYSSKFIDTYDFIRAVMVKDERSLRTLALTEDALNLNPANYSVWFYRRNILKELNSDLVSELKFVAELINDNPKNYQVWYHRQWIIDELSKQKEDIKSMIEDEFVFIDALLYEESKNYHVWQYRYWLVNNFKLWDEELKFTAIMLEADCFNNSAWNHRYYSIKSLSGFTDNIITQETEFVFKYILKAPENEGSWNYLSGLYQGKCLGDYGDLYHRCEELAKTDDNANKSPYLHSFMLDFNLSRLRTLAKQPSSGDTDKAPLLQSCLATCTLLGQTLDRIRINYWMYRIDQIAAEFATQPNNL